jgi:hypothetical protein
MKLMRTGLKVTGELMGGYGSEESLRSMGWRQSLVLPDASAKAHRTPREIPSSSAALDLVRIMT